MVTLSPLKKGLIPGVVGIDHIPFGTDGPGKGIQPMLVTIHMYDGKASLGSQSLILLNVHVPFMNAEHYYSTELAHVINSIHNKTSLAILVVGDLNGDLEGSDHPNVERSLIDKIEGSILRGNCDPDFKDSFANDDNNQSRIERNDHHFLVLPKGTH